MAAGDTVVAFASVANGAYQTIQPGASIEWLISNLYFGQNAEIYRTDGSHPILVASPLANTYLNINSRLTNGLYLTVKNISGGAAGYFGYDGIIWK